MFSRCSITFAANVCQCEWWQRPWRAWLMHFLAWGTSEKLERTSRKSLPRLEDECLWTILRDQAGIHTGYCTFTYFYYIYSTIYFSKWWLTNDWFWNVLEEFGVITRHHSTWLSIMIAVPVASHLLLRPISNPLASASKRLTSLFDSSYSYKNDEVSNSGKPHYVKPTPTASNAIPDPGSRSNSFQHWEARSMEAILVFDEAEGLFGRRNAEAASSVDKHLGYWSLPNHWGQILQLVENSRFVGASCYESCNYLYPIFFKYFNIESQSFSSIVSLWNWEPTTCHLNTSSLFRGMPI